MKRIFTSILSVVLPVLAFAGSNDAFILSEIESKNERINTAECVFTQVRAVPAAKTSVDMSGILYFDASKKISMLYDKPAGEYFIVNGNNLTMNKGGKKTAIDLAKVPSMNSLCKTLFYCIQGKIRTLAVEVNADCAVDETATDYVVTLTAKKKEVKGYAKIILSYNKKTGIIDEMKMEEFTGVTNTYKITSAKKNVQISPDKFEVK